MAIVYYETNNVPSSKWINGVTFTISGSEIPNNSMINSITINFGVYVEGISETANFRAILTKCIVSDGWENLVESNGSSSNPLDERTGTEPLEFSYNPNLKNNILTSNINSLTVTLTGQAPTLPASNPAYLSSNVSINIDYTPPYKTGGSEPGLNGNLNNYPYIGEKGDGSIDGDTGSLSINGNTVSSGSFNYSPPKFYSISNPYYLVYSSDNSSFTTINNYSTTSGSFIPKDVGIIADTHYYYYIIGYSSLHNGFVKSSYTGYTFKKDNTNPVINSVTLSSKHALASGTEITITINYTDAEENVTNYSIVGPNVSQTFATNTFTTVLYPGIYTIKITDSDGGETQTTITINSIDAFSINVKEKSIINNIDTTVLEEGLVKNIDRIEPTGLLGSSVINNLTFTVNYIYGTSSTDLTLGSGSLGTSEYFENIDIGILKPEIASNGLWYQFIVTSSYSYEGINQDAEDIYGPFKYPKQMADLSTNNYNIYNNNFNGNNEYVSYNIYNDKVYLTLTYPQNGTEEYSKINKVNVYVAYSEKENIDMSYLLINEFNTTSLTSDQFEVNIKDIVPYNNYFKLYLKLVTLTGEKKYIEIDKSTISPYDRLKRTFLPYFDNNIITSNLPKTIAVKNIDTNLILTIPTIHSINNIDGTDINSIKILLSKIIFRLSINESSYDSPILLSNCDSFYYDSSKKSLILSISPSSLLTMISNSGVDTTENTSYNAKIVFQPKDFFGNTTEQIFLVNSTNERKGEYVIFSLGVKPVLSTTSLNYALKTKIPYSSDVIFDITTNTTNDYKNMVNPKDILYLTFPTATDENGNDNGTSGNHGDIVGYKIKIQESTNTSFNVEEEYFKDFDILTVDNSNLNYDSSTGLYTYSYIIPDREYSSFAKFAICAYDTTNLESNYYIYEPIIILGKINYGAAAITNYKKNKTEDSSPNYNLTLKISDIGGNNFNNKSYNYSTYPNLERNVTGNVNDSRDVKFSLYYHTEDNSNFIKYDKELTYNINNTESTYTSYDNTITYSSLIDTPINFLNIDFSNTEVNLDNKNYFKFIIEVQNGFDNNGNKTYTTIETDTFIIFPVTPVMYFGKNAAGINTQELDNDKVLRIATIEQEKSLFQIDSFDEQSSVIFNLVSKIIEGIVISDED